MTKRERQYVDRLIAENGGCRSFPIKQCYWNAQRLIWSDTEKRLRYCESGFDPIPHAWVTINGKVVDVTAEAVARSDKRMGLEPTGRWLQYFGVMIDRRTAKANLLRKRLWAEVLDLEADWRKGWAAQRYRERAAARAIAHAARSEAAVIHEARLMRMRCFTI